MALAPLLRYRLDETAGGTTADSGRLGIPLTWQGSPAFGQPGLVSDGGTSVGFDGNTVAYASPVNPLPTLYKLSLEAWVSPTALGGAQEVFLYDSPAGNSLAWRLRLNGGAAEFLLPGYAVTGGVLVNGGTYRLRGTWDGTTARLIVGDNIVAEKATPGLTAVTDVSSNYIQVGGFFGSAERFVGRIDNCSLYDYDILNARAAAPPCRLYPRDDGLGASSATRQYPRPRGRQSGFRRLDYY